ncbi:MAG: Trk system potassium transporter TrkA [Treponema sp.]|nr:Trk system potassium transporter TrkA [Treponema sp.]
MRLVIVGGGFTGVQLAKLLIAEKNLVTLIDNDEDIARHASNQLDCTVMQADGNKLETLEDAGIAQADVLICVTSSDEVNMITCSLVDAVYPHILKIARVRNYAYYVNTAAARKAHEETFSGDRRPLYGIDHMLHPDVEAADVIVQAVQNGSVSDVLTFDDTDLQLTRMTIAAGSALCGQQLKNIRSLTEHSFLIAYVEEDGKTALPSGDTELKAGASIGMLACRDDIPALLALCGSKQKAARRIVVVGAGKIGTIVSEKLIQQKSASFITKLLGGRTTRYAQEFAIIDSDEKLAKAASENFPTAHVYHADATDESFLREEDIVSYDLAICVTHNHEMNMVLGAYLESLGVKQTISLVNNSAFVLIARKLGIDVPVPFRDVVVDSIMSHLRGKSVKGVHTLNTGDMEIIECVLPEESPVIGKTLRHIANPGEFLVLMLKRSDADSYQIPVGDTTLAAGDQLVLITHVTDDTKILAYFGSSQ